MLWREAVRLDWRLFGRSLQQSSGAAWVVLAAALIATAAMGESSYRLGVELRSHLLVDQLVPYAVARQVVAAFVAAFAFVLATGELASQRLLLADLALRPVSKRQAFFALQAVSTAGRHTLALLSVGLPLLILLGTWLDGGALAAAVVAVFVLMRLPVVFLTIGSRVAGASMTIAVTSAWAGFAMLVALWLVAPDLVINLLPPLLVARILLADGAAAGAWLGLVGWTLALAAIEFLTIGSEPAPVPSASAAPQSNRPISAAIGIAARLVGCSPVLLHGELLRLSRWRRHQFAWLLGTALIVMLGARLTNPDLLPVVVLLLLPAHVAGSTLANLFAVDRAGFQAFVFGPLGMAAVMRAKVFATLLFTMTAEAAVVAFLVARGSAWPVIAAGAVLAAGLFAWNAAIGMITSTLFPSPSDPQTIGGSLVNTSAFVVIAIGSTVYVGAAVGLAFLFDSGRLTLAVGALAGMGLVAVAAAALVAASRISVRLIAVRLEAIIAALTARTGART